MHSITSWLYQNVTGNLIANIIWEGPVWFLAMWRLERRQKKHEQRIHNQITESITNVADKEA